VQTWDLRYPEAAATALAFAPGRADPIEAMWVHAAPATLDVAVRDGDDRAAARGENLRRGGEQLPLTRLAFAGGAVTRADRWPR
jgi:hypothetical protein